MRAGEFSGTRTVSRKLALQALYRWQLNSCPWQDLVQEFGEAEDMPRADAAYFRTLVQGVANAHGDLEARLASFADRAPVESGGDGEQVDGLVNGHADS